MREAAYPLWFELTPAYGDPDYQSWMLDEATSIEHIKHAYARGINTFDTANV